MTDDDGTPPRGRGRPRVEESGLRLSTYVRTADYDRLLKLAQARDKSMSGLIRDLLRLKLR